MTLAWIVLGFSSVTHAQDEPPPPQDAVPIELPRPTYPTMAAFFGMNGYCEVRFAVDARGYAFNLYTSCTDYVFCYQSKKAVNEALFTPAYENGRARIRDNVIYPLEYIMEDVDPSSIDRSRIKPCRKAPIS
ncbi:MAG: energy transducer TonB [Pseudomonadota bacterium]